jgi:hypothetical protein
MIKPVRIPNFEGGLNLKDDTNIDDNQLSVCTNMFYNNERKLQTRYGQLDFGNPVPEAVAVVHNCEATSGWSVAEDADTLTSETSSMKRGTAALKFDIVAAKSANNEALLTNSGIAALTIQKGYVGFWLYAPANFTTNLTNVKLRIGSGASDYYEFTWLPADLTDASWNFLTQTFPTATGTPDDAAITYARLQINYTAGYTDKTGVMIDDIVTYSSAASKAMMSLKYFKEGVSPFTRHLVTNVGTNVFEYDEDSEYWTLIKTGVTEGARYAMTAYKDIQYYTNGVDNYASWNGKTWAEHTGGDTYKGKYLLLANDVGYILGDPDVPSSLAYTAATPTNLQTFPNVLLLDDDSSDGIGTGLVNLGPIVIASKNKKIYKVNIATPSREQLDYSDGNLSGRSFCRVENEVFLLNEGGVYTLSQREATTGSLRADPLSSDLQPLLDTITDKTTAAAYYDNSINNFYLFFDESGNGTHDTCVVFSTQNKKWTKYTNVNANEMVKYEDSDGVEHLLIANSGSGQCKEIETGLSDNNNPILCEVHTKSFDFEQPETLKTFEIIEVHGFITEDGEITVSATIDNEDTPEATILGSNYVTSAGSEALGAFLLGSSVLGGSGGESVTMYPFKARIPLYSTGTRIKVKLSSQTEGTAWILSKISIYPFPQPLEIYPEDQIL